MSFPVALIFVGSQQVMPSYVEWLTRLEMEAAVRKMRADDRSSQRAR